jgi:hypothetical protein
MVDTDRRITTDSRDGVDGDHRMSDETRREQRRETRRTAMADDDRRPRHAQPVQQMRQILNQHLRVVAATGG